MSRSTEFTLVFLLLAIAAFFRLYQLDSIPPGLWRDEARNGVDAVGILKGHTPIFFGDREPLFIYLQAASVAVLGRTELALRLVSAVIGVGTVGLTYALAAKLLGRWVGALAALALATSFWHVDISRLGLRAISVPLLALLSFYPLWIGLKRDKMSRSAAGLLWPSALSGLFLGLGFYTYLSSRLLPLVFVLFLGWLVVWRDLPLRRGMVMILTIGAASAIVFAPLGLYFLDNPDALFQHSAETSFFGSGPGRYNGPVSLLINLGNTLGMFTFRGDFNWRHNIAFRPVFGAISSVLFAGGLLYTLYRIRRREYAFLVIWFLVMLLPGILSIDSPHYLRTLVAAPAACVLVAVGIVAVGGWLGGIAPHLRFSLQGVKWLYAVAVATVLLMSALSAFRDYFQTWATSSAVYDAFEGDVADSATFLNSIQGEPLVFASAVYVPHPATLFLARSFANLRWYDSGQALVLPSSSSGFRSSPAAAAIGPFNEEAVFILLGSGSPWLPILERIYPEGTVIATGKRPDGMTSYSAFSVPSIARTGADIEPQHSLRVGFANMVQVVDYDLVGTGTRSSGPTIRPGETLQLILYWKPSQEASRPDLKFFTHVTDIKLNTWGQDDDIGYPSSQWRGNELVINRFDIKLAEDTPPGKYDVRFGAYYQSNMDRLPIIDSGGRPGGDAVSLPPIKVLPLSSVPPTPQRRASAALGGKAQLLGYDLLSGSKNAESEVKGPLQAGDKLSVKLYWKGIGNIAEDYTVFVHLTKSSGEAVAQDDGQPAGGAYPTSFWDEGEYISDLHEMSIPPTLSPGEYNLLTGMYLLSTGERLKTDSGSDSVKLATIAIE